MKLAPLVIALVAGCGSSSEPVDPAPRPTDKDASGPRGSIDVCDEAAEDLASVELGNYAEPEVRAPAVERYRKRCREEPLTGEELACITKASTKRWQAIECAPRMFADLARLVKADCNDVMQRLLELAAASDNPRDRARGPEAVEAMRASCTDDEWPPGARRCLLMVEGSAGVNLCMRELPRDVERKLRQRVNKARTR